jgi:hypothetical protein
MPIDTPTLSPSPPHPSLPCSLEGNTIRDQGASALAAILKKTQITNLECAAAPECSLLCQRPLTRFLTVLILPLAWQSRGQQNQSRWRLRARCCPQGDDDHQPKVRRLRVVAFVMSAPIDTLASFSLSPLLPSPAAQKCLLPCQRPLTRLLSHYSLTIPTPPLARSLGDNEFADQAKQAIKDAAGTSGVFIAL